VTRRKTDRRRKQLLADAERVIGERYGEFDLSLAEIAGDVGCSPRTLQRIFREVGGTDFRSYLLAARMQRARQLLSQKRPAPSVRDTARQIGFREASGLRQAFQRFYDGLNPSEVRTESYDYDAAWRAAEDRASRSTT